MLGEGSLKTHIEPTVGVEIQASMLVDAVHSRSGISLSSRLLHSSNVEAGLEMRRGEMIFRWDVPADKMNLLDFRYE